MMVYFRNHNILILNNEGEKFFIKILSDSIKNLYQKFCDTQKRTQVVWLKPFLSIF